MTNSPTVHASAVLAGTRAVLIRGPAGSGKSRLALALISAGQTGLIRFARLVGDDRVALEARHGHLLVRPAPALAGLIELRGLGIQRLAYEPLAVVGLVVDLAVNYAERMREPSEVTIEGVRIPRLAAKAGENPLPAILAMLATPETEIKPPS